MSTATIAKERTNSAATETDQSMPAKRRSYKKWMVLGILAVATIATLIYWLHARHYETTDDAQVDGHFVALSTRVNGTVTYVNPLAENDRNVTAGTLLLELDPRDYEAELEHATANLETKVAQAHAAQLQVPISGATAYSQLHLAEAARQESLEDVAAARADLDAAEHRVQQDEVIAARAERDRVRYASLAEKREISRSFYDARETDANAAAQALASDRAAVIAAQRKIAQKSSLVQQREAQIAGASTAPQVALDARAQAASALAAVDQARADVHTAQLNLSYSRIYAPVSGVIGHKTVEVGHRVQPGQSLLTIVPVDDIWITANFKETQLRHMQRGQAVIVHVDSFGRDYKGAVDDLAGAAGPLFGLFPPENASGNYVKIVQRFPVRIRIDQGQNSDFLLRPGMSVEATVRVR
jgi:membrane fusion protein, multidrug efflux system